MKNGRLPSLLCVCAEQRREQLRLAPPSSAAKHCKQTGACLTSSTDKSHGIWTRSTTDQVAQNDFCGLLLNLRLSKTTTECAQLSKDLRLEVFLADDQHILYYHRLIMNEGSGSRSTLLGDSPLPT